MINSKHWHWAGPVRLAGRVGVALLILGGAVVACVGVWDLVAALGRARWPTALGIVRHAEIVAVGEGSDQRYVVRVQYTYDACGAIITGDRMRFDDEGVRDSNELTRVLEQYPEDRAVDVNYNPEEPSESVLDRGLPWAEWLRPCLGVLCVAAGMWAWRALRPTRGVRACR